MKILHLTHTDILADNRILKEILALAELPDCRLYGVGVRQHAGGQNTRQTSQAKIVSLALFARHRWIVPRPVRHLLVALELFARLFYHGARLRPDVVHCHDTPVLLVGVLLKRVFGAKLIYDAHELESNKNGQGRWMSRATWWSERLAWPSIDHFISVSPSIIDWYRDKLGPKPGSLILNSPLMATEPGQGDAACQKSRQRQFHQRYGIPDAKRVFLYLGLLVPGRGIEKLLEAFSAREVESHVVFVGYGGIAEDIQRAASTNDRIHLHPPVPHEEVVSLSMSADFGLCIIEAVSLSDYYCLPNKLFEYAFAGIPVLASGFPDITRVVEEHGLGECCNPDTSSIIAAIRRIESDSCAFAPRNLQKLGWESQGARLRQAYQEMLTCAGGDATR